MKVRLFISVAVVAACLHTAVKAQTAGSGGPWGQNGTTIYYNAGNAGIGTTAPGQKLTVKGQIHAEEVIVRLNAPAPDYVFSDGYRTMPPGQLEKYISGKKHLPGIPPAREMEKNGIGLCEMNMLILKKVEELTLYVIDHEKRIEKLENAKKQ